MKKKQKGNVNIFGTINYKGIGTLYEQGFTRIFSNDKR